MVDRSGTSSTSTKKGRCRRNAATTRTSPPCALPSAGITQIRFEGRLSPLSLSRGTPSGHVSVAGKHTTPWRRRRADRPQARPDGPPPSGAAGAPRSRRASVLALQRVPHGLDADQAVAKDERVDAVLHARVGRLRRPLEEQDVVGEHGLELPLRVRDIADKLDERLPDAVLATQGAVRADEDGVVRVVADDPVDVAGPQDLTVVLEHFFWCPLVAHDRSFFHVSVACVDLAPARVGHAGTSTPRPCRRPSLKSASAALTSSRLYSRVSSLTLPCAARAMSSDSSVKLPTRLPTTLISREMIPMAERSTRPPYPITKYVPPTASIAGPCTVVPCSPTKSSTASTPLPPVSSRTCSTASSPAFTTLSAPMRLAICRASSETSTAMISAPLMALRHCTPMWPRPPMPMTAQREPGGRTPVAFFTARYAVSPASA